MQETGDGNFDLPHQSIHIYSTLHAALRWFTSAVHNEFCLEPIVLEQRMSTESTHVCLLVFTQDAVLGPGGLACFQGLNTPNARF